MDERVTQYFRLDSWLFWTIVEGEEQLERGWWDGVVGEGGA